MDNVSKRLLPLLIAVCVVAVACGADAVTVVGEAPAATATVAPDPTPPPEPEPTAPPVDGELPEPLLPVDRPADFVATYSEDGGMAPWYERVEVRDITAQYLVWMDGLELRFEHTPAPERIDALYEALRLGRFELYEVVPFEDGEMIYDHETTSWRVRAGEFNHRISTAGEDIDRPSTDHFPLSGLSRFVDEQSVPGATNRATIRIAEGDLWDIVVLFDLGDADFAMGDERWADEIEFSWSGGPTEITATVILGEDTDDETRLPFDLTIADGGVIDIGRDDAGQIVVS